MSREIWFRAWDKHNKEFLQGYFLTSTIRHDSNIIEVCGVDDGSYDAPHEMPTDVILMQYTGLKDMNGADIYEGDILGVTAPMGTTTVCSNPVSVSHKSWTNHYKHVVEFTPSGLQLASHYANSCKCEVIGNIYQNSDLLAERGE